ncbi:hypothetical protein EVA_09903 [gut metagenome]|uniref:Uncharacterized protein n=1 Tax=gut metagenome TaxID=749906 RepID=J9CPC9_9ZZZZ
MTEISCTKIQTLINKPTFNKLFYYLNYLHMLHNINFFQNEYKFPPK